MDAAGRKPAVHEIAVVYPGDSLTRQVAAWARKHADCVIEPVFAKSLPEIRGAIQHVDLAVVDATADHAQSVDALSQAVARLGASATAVYTERMHEGLEPFVRFQGCQLLFGPLSDVQWEDFFAVALRRHKQPGRMAA